MITQEMADDICASVPFSLGTKVQGGPGDRDGVEYPYVGTQRVSEQHRRAASALGGWHLLEPMRTCVRTRADSVRDGQVDWIKGQMQRIGKIYALQSSTPEGSPVDQQIYDQKLFDQYEFHCPS